MTPIAYFFSRYKKIQQPLKQNIVNVQKDKFSLWLG